MLKISEPDWLKALRGDSHLDSREILNLYGCAEGSDVSLLIQQGVIPRPMNRLSRNKTSKLLWKVSDVRDLINSKR